MLKTREATSLSGFERLTAEGYNGAQIRLSTENSRSPSSEWTPFLDMLVAEKGEDRAPPL